MLRGQPIVEDDRQITRFGKLHPELSKRDRAAERPAAAVQVDRHRMRTGPLRHRDVRAKASAQLDIFFECTDCGEVLIINDRQLFPGAALRDHVAGRIPARQLRQNLSIVCADPTSYRPVFRNVSRRRCAATPAGRRRGEVRTSVRISDPHRAWRSASTTGKPHTTGRRQAHISMSSATSRLGAECVIQPDEA
jgi:hypothetical protein